MKDIINSNNITKVKALELGTIVAFWDNNALHTGIIACPDEKHNFIVKMLDGDAVYADDITSYRIDPTAYHWRINRDTKESRQMKDVKNGELFAYCGNFYIRSGSYVTDITSGRMTPVFAADANVIVYPDATIVVAL